MSRKKKIRNGIVTVILWFIIWQVVAMKIDNSIFLPSPIETVQSLQQLFFSTTFFLSVSVTLGNIVKGFLLGVLFGSIFSVIASLSEFLETFITFPMRIIKATPVASFTILALFWLDSSSLSILVSFFMVLPILYTNVLTGIKEINPKLLEMSKVFQIRWYYKVCFLYIPEVLPYLFSACSVAIGLAWKSGIAAEVIGITKNSIGNHLYQAKLYLEMPKLFAWSFVIISISIASEHIVLGLIHLLEQSIYGIEKKNFQEEKEQIKSAIEDEKNSDVFFMKEDKNFDDNRIKLREVYELDNKQIVNTMILKDITKSYGENLVLDKVSFIVSSNQPIALMGKSGVGKTTLFRIILGLETADVGTLQKEKQLERSSVVFQENRLLEQLTVEKNLKIVCRTKKQREEIEELLSCLGLKGCAKQKVNSLSGGMKRRVAIGRAILFDAPVFLLDEPFQGLDIKTKQQVMQLVKQTMKGKIVLLITHEKEEAVFLGYDIIEIK